MTKEDISRKTLLVLVLTAIAISAVTTSIGLMTLEKVTYEVPSDITDERPGIGIVSLTVPSGEPMVSEPVSAKISLRVK